MKLIPKIVYIPIEIPKQGNSCVLNYPDMDKYLKPIELYIFTKEELTKTLTQLLENFHNGNKYYLTGKEDDNLDIKDFIKTILPKTEWDVEFDEQGKLKLI